MCGEGSKGMTEEEFMIIRAIGKGRSTLFAGGDFCV